MVAGLSVLLTGAGVLAVAVVLRQPAALTQDALLLGAPPVVGGALSWLLARSADRQG